MVTGHIGKLKEVKGQPKEVKSQAEEIPLRSDWGHHALRCTWEEGPGDSRYQLIPRPQSLGQGIKEWGPQLSICLVYIGVFVCLLIHLFIFLYIL